MKTKKTEGWEILGLQNFSPKRARYCKVRRILVSPQSSWLPLMPITSMFFSVTWLVLKQLTSRGLTTMSPTFP